jgi:fibronectin type 3 domain-containing protein
MAAATHSVGLSWDASSSSVQGYNVYRGTVSSGPYSKLTASLDAGTNYTDTSVQSSTTYYYVTTAVGTDGVESSYSNQVKVAIP